MPTQAEAERAAVVQVIDRWRSAFNALDPDALCALWDQTYPHIVYQPEEFPDALHGWREVESYYRAVVKIAQNLRDQSLTDLEMDLFGELAWVYHRGRVTFDIVGKAESVPGEVRHTFILRKVDGAWKIIHYHESREAPGLRQYVYDAHPRGKELRAQDQKSQAAPR